MFGPIRMINEVILWHTDAAEPKELCEHADRAAVVTHVLMHADPAEGHAVKCPN